uniref:Uncharacterized protein n=1 Tax=Physcomitrium patens TaxID=3218 RepID=A0A2K1K233_PHYPA|nr:hypothetical protein PHYPA_012312 [Physcomitrium patens]
MSVAARMTCSACVDSCFYRQILTTVNLGDRHSHGEAVNSFAASSWWRDNGVSMCDHGTAVGPARKRPTYKETTLREDERRRRRAAHEKSWIRRSVVLGQPAAEEVVKFLSDFWPLCRPWLFPVRPPT